MLEYVLVTLLVVTPMLTAGDIMFDIKAIAEGDVANFGFLGTRFTYRWHTVMSGIGLPLP